MNELPKWMRNQVFEAVQAAGLGPEEFLWEDSANRNLLRHRSSEAYFGFEGPLRDGVYRRPRGLGELGGYVGGDFGRYFGPGRTRVAFDWSTQMQYVAQWLEAVKDDTETPDLWGELFDQIEPLAGAADDGLENTPFTPDERDGIARQLSEIREYVKGTYSLSGLQLVDLNSKLDYLVDAASRLGRKDWPLLCIGIGVVVAWIPSVALPPDASRHLFELLLNVAAHFFRHGLPGLDSG